MSPPLRSARRLAGAVLLALLSLSQAHAQSANPYIEPAAKLYQSFEFQNALRSIDKALQWPSNTPAEEVRIALLEGLITAQMGKSDRALSAFKRALMIPDFGEKPEGQRDRSLMRQQVPEHGFAGASGFNTATFSPAPQLTWIIHDRVSRNEQTPPLPELRSREAFGWLNRPFAVDDAFALFRQYLARPCSGLRE